MQVSRSYKETLKKKYTFNKDVKEYANGISYIGYGHKVKDRESFDKSITRVVATDIFNKDIKGIVNFLNKTLNREVPQHHFDILVSLCYDMGTKAVRNSMFYNLYKKNFFEEAFSEYMTFSRQNGSLNKNFYKRRKEELRHIHYVINT